MHKALRCTLLSDPPLTSIFYYHHPIHVLCNSAIDVIFPILFCCNHLYCIFVCPRNVLLQPTFFSLCLCAKLSNIMLSMSSLLAILAYLCMEFDCPFHSLFYPTSHKMSLSSVFQLALQALTFLQLVIASFVLNLSSSPFALLSLS